MRYQRNESFFEETSRNLAAYMVSGFYTNKHLKITEKKGIDPKGGLTLKLSY